MHLVSIVPSTENSAELNCHLSIHDEMEFPESPVSKGELRRDFFPIPWRVIGGGVLVGVKREGDGDEREAESSNTGGTNHSSSKQTSNMSPIKIVTRQRSNSIPPTPSTAQVKVERVSALSSYVSFSVRLKYSCSHPYSFSQPSLLEFCRIYFETPS